MATAFSLFIAVNNQAYANPLLVIHNPRLKEYNKSVENEYLLYITYSFHLEAW